MWSRRSWDLCRNFFLLLYVCVEMGNEQLSVSLGKSLKALLFGAIGKHGVCIQHCRNKLSGLSTLPCVRWMGRGLLVLGKKVSV